MSRQRPTHRDASDVMRLADHARSVVASEGVIKIRALGPKPVRDQVAAALSKSGLEITKTVVRKPIAAQLESALADGAFIPIKRIALYARGATAAEAKPIALALVAVGAAALVVRGVEQVLVPINAGIVSRSEVLGLEALAKAAAKVVRSKSGASLLRSDLSDALAKAMPEVVGALTGLRPAKTPALPKTAPNGPFQRLLAAVDATRDSTTGLSFVPAIVAWLGHDLSPTAACAALESAASHGLLELRPEGGINRLSPEELSICPQGPQGTRLSWARRTGRAS